MTSSYNISRRKLDTPTNWGAYQTQLDCHGGYLTVPIKTSGAITDWKFCVPILNEDNMPSSYVPTSVFMKNNPVKTRHYTSNLYNSDLIPDRSPMNLYPPGSRRVSNWRELVEQDYFQLQPQLLKDILLALIFP